MKHSIFIKRKISITFIADQEAFIAAIVSVKKNSFIKNIDYLVTHKTLLIEYDQRLVDFSRVLSTLTAQGIHYKKGFIFNGLSNWYDYVDNAARDNSTAPPPACCNKPPKR